MHGVPPSLSGDEQLPRRGPNIPIDGELTFRAATSAGEDRDQSLERRLRRRCGDRFGLVELLHAEAGDGPGDDELLDLLGALEDVEDLRVAVPALDRVLL